MTGLRRATRDYRRPTDDCSAPVVRTPSWRGSAERGRPVGFEPPQAVLRLAAWEILWTRIGVGRPSERRHEPDPGVAARDGCAAAEMGGRGLNVSARAAWSSRRSQGARDTRPV